MVGGGITTLFAGTPLDVRAFQQQLAYQKKALLLEINSDVGPELRIRLAVRSAGKSCVPAQYG
jgi:hypothetical protein